MGIDQEHWQRRLDELAARHGVVGASLAIRLRDEAAEAATGVLNLRTGQPVTPDSLFQIGSITKVWTARLVLQLLGGPDDYAAVELRGDVSSTPARCSRSRCN